MNTELKYRTFDDLMNEVQTDFHVYNNEGMIDPAQLIKVAQRVTYDLGLRIYKTKERIIDIENGKAKLPNDFYVMNYAMLLGTFTVKKKVPMGVQTEEVMVTPGESGYNEVCTHCNLPEQSCTCENVIQTNDCGDSYQLVQKTKYETRTYTLYARIRFQPSKYLAQNCVNTQEPDVNFAQIKNGFIYTNLVSGQLYISYEGDMEDDEGNLLVLDHPMINEYYEYAVKQRILENLAINGEDVARRMELIEARYRVARNHALSIVNTPSYAELQSIWEVNRKAQYAKYYDMFRSITPQR
jgi:hypothetical protein